MNCLSFGGCFFHVSFGILGPQRPVTWFSHSQVQDPHDAIDAPKLQRLYSVPWACAVGFGRYGQKLMALQNTHQVLRWWDQDVYRMFMARIGYWISRGFWVLGPNWFLHIAVPWGTIGANSCACQRTYFSGTMDLWGFDQIICIYGNGFVMMNSVEKVFMAVTKCLHKYMSTLPMMWRDDPADISLWMASRTKEAQHFKKYGTHKTKTSKAW